MGVHNGDLQWPDTNDLSKACDTYLSMFVADKSTLLDNEMKDKKLIWITVLTDSQSFKITLHGNFHLPTYRSLSFISKIIINTNINFANN